MTMTNNTNSGFIELNAFIKAKGIASTGGNAKNIIRSGKVKVNDEIETRNKKKLFIDDVVEFDGNKFVVDDSIDLKHHQL